MLEKKNSDLELKIKVLEIQGKLKEIKQEKEKIEDRLIQVSVTFIGCVVCSLVLFFSKGISEQKIKSWATPSFGMLAIVFLLFWLILYKNCWKKKKQIEQLEKELYLLKKDSKEK